MNTKGRSIKETKKAINEEVGPFTLFLVTLGADLINALQREGRPEEPMLVWPSIKDLKMKSK